MHKLFQDFFVSIPSEKLNSAQSFENYKTLFEEVLTLILPKDLPARETYKDGLKNFAHLQAILAYHYKKNNNDEFMKYFYPVHRELYIKSPADKLHGVVDRIDLIPSPNGESYIVVDYKSGTRKPGKNKKDEYVIPSDTRRQLAYYKVLAESYLNNKVDYVCVFYSQHCIKVVEKLKKITFTKAFEARDKALKLVNEARASGKYPMNIGRNCQPNMPYYFGCDYYHVCSKNWSKQMLQSLGL